MIQRKEPVISRPAVGVDAAQGAQDFQVEPVIERPTPSSSMSFLAIAIALIALGSSGVTYWLLDQANTTLQATEQQLQTTQKQLQTLENRLTLADGESTQSLEAIQLIVKENSSEVRKLWGVAYDRNRKAISALKETLAKQEKASKAAVNKVSVQASKNTKTLVSLEKTLSDQKADVAVLDELQEGQQQLVQHSHDLVQKQSSEIQSALKKIAQLEKAIASQEEAVKSIDAFRQQMNREILALKAKP